MTTVARFQKERWLTSIVISVQLVNNKWNTQIERSMIIDRICFEIYCQRVVEKRSQEITRKMWHVVNELVWIDICAWFGMTRHYLSWWSPCETLFNDNLPTVEYHQLTGSQYCRRKCLCRCRCLSSYFRHCLTSSTHLENNMSLAQSRRIILNEMSDTC